MGRFEGPSAIFTVIFLFFVVVIFIRGSRAVFLAKGRPERIGKEWGTFFSLASYIIIIIGGLLEYFIVDRKIDFIISFLGLVIFTSAVFLRNISIETLGECWSIHVRADHVERIVKDGPYKYIKHPYYLASISALLGMLLIVNSYYTIFFIFVMQLPLYLMRIYQEEKELVKKFGKEYINYKKGVVLI